MSASVPTLVPGTPGPAAGGLFAAPAGGGPLAGFEALMAALFGGTEGEIATTPAAPSMPGAAPAPAVLATADDTDLLPEPAPDMAAEATPPPDMTAVPAAFAALVQPAAPAPSVETPSAVAKTETPHGGQAIQTPKAPALTSAPIIAAPANVTDEASASAPEVPTTAKGAASSGMPDAAAQTTAAPPAREEQPARTIPQAPALATATMPVARSSPAKPAPAVSEPALAAGATAPEVEAAPVTQVATRKAEADPVLLQAAAAPVPPTANAAPAPNRRQTAAKGERDKAATPGAAPDSAPVAARPAAAPGASAKAAPVEIADAVTAPGADATPTKPDADLPARADIAPAESRASQAQTGAPAQQPVRAAPETVASLATRIVRAIEGRTTRFDVELEPLGLGRVEVRVEIAAHGRVSAAMTFDNPQAAADMRARSAELQRSLEQAGFDLSGGLSFDVAGERHQGRHADQQAQGHAGDGFRGRAFQAALDAAGEADLLAQPGELRLRRGVTAGVDLRI